MEWKRAGNDRLASPANIAAVSQEGDELESNILRMSPATDQVRATAPIPEQEFK